MKIFKLSLLVLSATVFSTIGISQIAPWDENNAFVEKVNKRDQLSKHFIDAEGNHKVYMASGPIHYPESYGWEEIDLTIEANNELNNKTYPFANTKNAFKTFYSTNPFTTGVLNTFNGVSISEKISSVYFADENLQKTKALKTAYNGELATNKNYITYSNVYADIDLSYSQKNTGRKFDMILNSPNAIAASTINDKFIVIEEVLKIPLNWEVKKINNHLSIFDGEKEIAVISQPLAYETNSTLRNYESENDFRNLASIEFSKNGELLTIKSIFELNWLLDSKRNYPISLDPTIDLFPLINTAYWTGYQTTSSAKTNGYIRVTTTGTNVGFAKFNTTTLAGVTGITVKTANYHGYHYTTTGVDKICHIVDLQNIDPVTATPLDLNNQIVQGPSLFANYIFGGAAYQWRVGNLPPSAYNTIANRISQGFIGLGFRYNSGNTSFMYQYGNDASPVTNVCFFELEYTTVFPNDAGLANLAGPENPICNGTNSGSSVNLELENTGTDTLKTLTINWNVNGQNQPVYNYVGSLLPGAKQVVNIGNYAGGFVKGDFIDIWSVNPNNVPDSNKTNDTLTIEIFRGISGHYTVGGTNADFASFSEVQSFLDTSKAVCDSVIFTVAQGDYYEKIVLPSMFNASFQKPVIFRAAPGANVNLMDTLATSPTNYIVRLNRGNGYIFENINFKNLSGGNFKKVIDIPFTVNDISFINCTFENQAQIGTSVNQALVKGGNNTYCQNINFNNCTFNNGTFALWFDGNNRDSTNSNISVTNSTFSGQSFKAVYFNTTSNLSFKNNNINFVSVAVNNVATHIDFNYGSLTIENNYIQNNSITNTKSLLVSQSKTFPNVRPLIANNYIITGDDSSSSDCIGLELYNVYFGEIFHNTVVNKGQGLSSYSVKINRGGGLKFNNNLVVNLGQGLAISAEDSVTFQAYSSNYNNYYSNGANTFEFNGQQTHSLAQWRAQTGDELNSHNINPAFAVPGDYHLCSQQLDNLGTPVTGIKTDFDGQLRNTVTPDIGADEYTSPTNFTLGNDLEICKGESTTLNALLNINPIGIAWSTGDTTETITVSTPGTYWVTSGNVCGFTNDTIIISNPPTINIGNDFNICPGQTATLNASVTNGAFKWNTGSTQSSITIDEGGVYTVNYTDINGCKSADTIFVTQSLSPNLPKDTSLCSSTAIFLNGNAGPGNYTWNTGANTPSILVSTSGKYVVTFTDAAGCTISDSSNVQLSNIPDASFTTSLNYMTAIFNSNNTTGGNYLWSFGDGDTSSQQNPIHVYKASGMYNVTLRIENQCGLNNSVDTVRIIVSSVDNIEQENSLVMYPNPAMNNVQFISSYIIEKINVISPDGKIVQTEVPNNTSTNLIIENLTKGIYIIEIKTTNETVYQRLIKH